MSSYSFSLAQLNHFVATARLGTMTQAADRCGVSEPALSVSIRRLERLLATDLFTRHAGAGVELTDTGRALLPLAEELIAGAERINNFAAERHGTASLRVGCTASIYPFVVPMLQADDRRMPLAHYRRLEPVVAKDEDLRQMVAGGRIDMWIGMSADPDPALQSETFHRAISLAPYVIGSARTLSGHGSTITMRDLAQHRICVLEEPVSIRYVSQLFREHGQRVPPLVKLQTWESLRSVAAAGPELGILSIPAPPVSISGVQLVIRRIAEPVADIHLGVFAHPGRASGLVVHRVADLCRRAMLASLAAVPELRVG